MNPADWADQINYRHFEDDMNPRVFKKEGLKHLDRVIELVSRSEGSLLFPYGLMGAFAVRKIQYLHRYRPARNLRRTKPRLASASPSGLHK